MTDYNSTMERLKNLRASYSEAYTEAEYRIRRELTSLSSEIAKLEIEVSESVTTADEAWSDFTRFRGIVDGHKKWLAFQKWITLSPILTERQVRNAQRYLNNCDYHFFSWDDYEEGARCWERGSLKEPHAQEFKQIERLIDDKFDLTLCKRLEREWMQCPKKRPSQETRWARSHFTSDAQTIDAERFPKARALAAQYRDALDQILEPDSS
jgi:hypothetical protein